MNQNEPYIPDGVSEAEAYARCSHLGIGAHQDDLEFMAFHGISICYQDDCQWFGGITCTDGAGSSRAGPYKDFTDDQMKAVRSDEQKEAALIGNYSFCEQLRMSSLEIKSEPPSQSLVDQLEHILLRSQPEVVYTHNPADKHATHVAITAAALTAIRKLPPYSRPKKLFGCEVWRGLDWLCDEDKIALDVSGHDDLAERLHACFASQIEGGKNYANAVVGRSIANATFYDAHSVDTVNRLWYAIDLSILIDDEALTLRDFTKALLDRFSNKVLNRL